MVKTPKRIIVSACLTGLCTRYDGNIKENPEIHNLLEQNICYPVCPEQLGGLPTPRIAADVVNGTGDDVLNGKAQVITKEGEDVTAHFIKGAEETLKIAKMCNCSHAVLKARSPSCGSKEILGVAAALLLRNGITVEEL